MDERSALYLTSSADRPQGEVTQVRLAAFIVAAGLAVIGALATIAMIGKPRKPISPGLAIYTLIWQVVWVACVYYLYSSAS